MEWRRSGPSPPVLKYYAYKATSAVELYRPIMYLYLLEQGLGFEGIVVVEAAYNVATVLGEVPTGWVGDRVGRRASLLIGTGIIAATLVGIGLATTFPAFLVLFVAWSMGYNFRSGSEDAWLYDRLEAVLSTDAFAHVRGRGEAIALAVGVVGAVAGGALGAVDLRYPFFAAAGVTAIGAVALLSMGETDGGGEGAIGFGEALAIVRRALSERGLRSFVVYYYVLFSAVTYLVFIFLQPALESVLGGFGLGAADVAGLLGLYYAAISLLAAWGSANAGWIRDRLGLRTWFLLLPVLVGGTLVGMAALPLLAIPGLLLVRVLAEVTTPLASQYVNDRIRSVGRATVLSAMAMVSGLTVVPFQLASGVLASSASPILALAGAGAVLLVGSLLVASVELPVLPVAPADQHD